MKKFITLVATFIVTTSCAPFVDSPFSDQLLRPDRNINQTSISKLGDIEADGVIRFAVFSDSHQNYKALDEVMYQMNQQPQLDFVAGLGDYTNSGYNMEYNQFIDAIEYLKWPRILAIGNHDSIGAGPDIFKRAFGESNFYFESTSYRFIYFDSNNLENPGHFNPQWLLDRVTESTKPCLIFSHVQLRDTDRFFGNDAAIFNSVITNPKVKLILNGHNHVYDYSTDNNTIMLQVGRTEGQHWVIVEITGANFCVKRMDTGEQTCQAFK